VVAPVPPGSDLSKALKFDFVMPFCVVAALLGRFGATPPEPARNWRAGAFVRSGRSATFAVLVFEKGT
jgi:hypothetical protein